MTRNIIHYHTHQNTHSETNSNESNSNETNSKGIHVGHMNHAIFRSTLLATSIVQCKNENREFIRLRALVDLGGEASAISESACQLLNAKNTKCAVNDSSKQHTIE